MMSTVLLEVRCKSRLQSIRSHFLVLGGKFPLFEQSFGYSPCDALDILGFVKDRALKSP